MYNDHMRNRDVAGSWKCVRHDERRILTTLIAIGDGHQMIEQPALQFHHGRAPRHLRKREIFRERSVNTVCKYALHGKKVRPPFENKLFTLGEILKRDYTVLNSNLLEKILSFHQKKYILFC